jgi:hypothetical protein
VRPGAVASIKRRQGFTKLVSTNCTMLGAHTFRFFNITGRNAAYQFYSPVAIGV